MCLLHEKPFAGVNGSGKHNNWSMVTDDGINLLDPGSTPHENMVFMTMLCAVVRGVDKHAKILRAAVANVGNEHRLGANEAPPAIVSVFLGDQLTDIFQQLARGSAKSSKRGGELKLGVSHLPPLPKDCTDRNRTSPFAFTGNRFEFRMVGSLQSTAGPSFVLNTVAADALAEIADELEKATDVPAACQAILSRIAKDHERIVFNGDNYSPEWVDEAARRGLPNIASTVESLETLFDDDCAELFERHAVLTRAELRARTEILLEGYCKQINIEASTMSQMARRQIVPSALAYAGHLAGNLSAMSEAGLDISASKATLEKINAGINELISALDVLDSARQAAADLEDSVAAGRAYRDQVRSAMAAVRTPADTLESLVDADMWPLPSYAEMLFMR